MTDGKPSWRQTAPEFLQFLEGTLNYHMRLHQELLGYQVYLVDLSDWKLRFSDRTPFIWVRAADIAALDSRGLLQSLLDVIKTRDLADRNPVVLLDGPGHDLQAAFRSTFMPILVLDQDAQDAVRGSRRPTAELLERLTAQIDLALLVPYETSKPVTGSRFFGRESEVRRILQHCDSNFAIMGIRRIGKTSLMREIERQLKEQAQERGRRRRRAADPLHGLQRHASPSDFIQEVVRRCGLRSCRGCRPSSSPSSSRISCTAWRSATAAR